MIEEKDIEARSLHEPVLVNEAVEALKLEPDGRYIDATLGTGGHAEAILRRSSPGGRLLGIDRDREALKKAGDRLRSYGQRFTAREGNFKDIGSIARESGWDQVEGILFDLGLSSLQVDSPHRGFSFRHRSRLDMRMDRNQELSAWEVVNHFPGNELAGIFKEYGEERLARPIARAIDRQRNKGAIETTTELAGLVASVYGSRRGRIHPATRVFQALRIFVNGELENLEEALPRAIDLLSAGGRLAVISYHSLEDRMVKRTFRKFSGRCQCPAHSPACLCGAVRKVRVVTAKPMMPAPEEMAVNRRARSARLRVAEKMGEGH